MFLLCSASVQFSFLISLYETRRCVIAFFLLKPEPKVQPPKSYVVKYAALMFLIKLRCILSEQTTRLTFTIKLLPFLILHST